MSLASGLWAVALLAGAALLSFALVEATRRYALRQGVLDVPNERSSHTAPTPRGGGMGVVLPVAASMLVFGLSTSFNATAAGVSAALITAAVGWVDDHRGLSVAARLPLHVVAGVLVAVLVLELSTPYPPFIAAGVAVWWIFWTVAAINVANFMDGSDGMLGLQGLLYGAFTAVALPAGPDGRAIALVTAGAFAGFLALNRPPARIFLGDVGSGAAGVIFVLLGVLVVRAREWSIFAVYLPLAPLFVDELLTMIRRIRERRDLRKAHRTHYYQRLIRSGWGHGSVAALFALLSVVGALIALTLGGRLQVMLPAAAVYVAGVALALSGLTRRAERMAGHARPG